MSLVEFMDRKVEENKQFCIDVLKKLISIPTVNPPGEKYEEMCSYLAEVLKNLGLKVKVVKVPKDIVGKYYPQYVNYPRFIVLGEFGKGKPVIHFNGHYDVVPAGSGWSKDPFKPVIEEGKLYGRGASDMKGGIASIILAAKALTESKVDLKGKIELSFTPDEEIGGLTGVGYIVDQGIIRPDYAIIAEPSGLNNIWIGNKGAVWITVEVFGKQAHGSTPWLGVNAFEKTVELAYRIIRELKPKIEAKKSKYDYGDPRGAKATINIGGEVKGGAKVNIVPGYFSFSIDRRTIPEESADEAAKEIVEFINNVAKEIPELKVNVKVMSKFNATVSEPTTKLVKTAVKSAKEVLGYEPATTVCIGGLDTRYFQEKGVQAITYGPGVPSTAHMADEYIKINDMVKMAKIYARIITKLLS